MDTKELIAELRAWIKEKYPMQGHKSGALLRDAADELERLVAIVERLPKTTDGAPITPGMTVWFADDEDEFLQITQVTLFSGGGYEVFGGGGVLADEKEGPHGGWWSSPELARHEAKHHGLDSFAEKDAAHKRLAEAIHEREQEALEALAELDEANAALAAAIKERDALRAIVDAARAVRSTGFQSRRADDGGRFLVGDDEYRALVNALEKEARDGTV